MKVRIQSHLSVVFAFVLVAGMVLASLAGHPDKAKASGTGTEDDPIIIRTAEEFDDIRNDLSAHYKLGNDIDLDYSYWNPIGGEYEPFAGSLDGDGYAILNLSISSPMDDHVGLFRRLTGEIKNVRVMNAGVYGYDNVGILFGSSMYGKVENCTVQGTVKGSYKVGGLGGSFDGYGQIKNSYADANVTGEGTVGGLIGYAYASNLIDNTTSGAVTVSDNYAGGMVGALYSSFLKNSSAMGSVTGLHEGGLDFGGLVGQSNSGSIVEYSNATGTVTSHGSSLGGLIGDNQGMVRKSFARNEIRAVGNGAIAGGLVGTSTSGTIEDSYALGSVQSMSDGIIGGLVGLKAGTIKNSYASVELREGPDNTVGGLVGSNMGGAVTGSYYNSERAGVSDTDKGAPKTMSELQQAATFNGWNFGSVWSVMENMDTPKLRYTVTYDSNGSSGGTVPVDTTFYPGESQTAVMDNTGGLVHDRAVFAGWSTKPKGIGDMYLPGNDLYIVTNNVTLYANWEWYTYGIDALDTQSLAALNQGYASGSQETKTVTITRAGTGDLAHVAVALTGAGSENFVITGPAATTLNSATPSTTFTVRAKDGLPMGAYSAKMVISADYMEDVSVYVNQSVNPPGAVKGDATGDGVVSPADALLITKHMAGKITLTPEQIEALDMNNDGVLDNQDVRLIMDIYLGRN